MLTNKVFMNDGWSPTSFISDISLYIPNKFRLPIHIKNFKGKSFEIYDNLNTYIGYYPSIICKVIYNGEPIIDGDYVLDSQCIHLYPERKSNVLINGIQYTKPDLYVNDTFTNSVSGNISITPNIIPTPICSESPLYKINTAYPDAQGRIIIESSSPHIIISKVGESSIKLSSDLHNEDFDKNSLVGPQGDVGNEGPKGDPGIDAVLSSQATNGRYYTCGWCTMSEFNTINVMSNFVSNGNLYYGTSKIEINKSLMSNQWKITQLGKVTTAINGNIIGTDDGYIDGVNVIGERIERVHDVNNWISTTKICIDGIITNRTTETNIRKIGSDTYILYTNGIKKNNSFFPTDYEVYDTDGIYFVGQKVYKLNPYPYIYFSPDYPLYCINGLFMAGDKGLIYKTSPFTRYKSPAIKDWRSIWMENTESVWVCTQ